MRTARALAIAVAAGTMLGCLEQGLRHASPPIPWLTALGVPWLATAFVVGALVRGRRRAPLAAAAALVVAVATYYLVMYAVVGHTSGGYALRMFVAWSLAAAPAGAAFGLLGAMWRRAEPRRSTLATAAMSGAFAGEALLLLGTWRTHAAQAVLACELMLRAAPPLVLAPPRQPPPAPRLP